MADQSGEGMTLRDFWPLYVGMVVAGSAAVVASASTLAALAESAKWAGWTPWLLPACLDVTPAVGVWVWLRPGAPERARRFGRWVTLIGAAGTLAGNAVGHLVAAGFMTPGPILVVVVGAVPAAAVLAIVELAALLTRQGTAVAPAVPVPAPAPVAETAPPVPVPAAVEPPAPAPQGDGPDLEAAAREAARRIRAAGGKPSGVKLARVLRADMGVSVRNDRIPSLVALVTDDDPDDAEGERVPLRAVTGS